MVIEQPGAGSSRGRALLFLVVAAALPFVLVEGCARVVEIWVPPRPVDYGLGLDPGYTLFVPDPEDPDLRVTRPERRWHFAVQRFPAQKAPGTLRIAVLGGSSVRNLAHQLERSKVILRERLSPGYGEVEIIVAGGRSYGSRRLVTVLAELLGYDLDLLLIYTGHNEFEEVEQIALAKPTLASFEAFFARSAAFRLLRDRLTDVLLVSARREHDARVASPEPQHARAWRHTFSAEEVAERMEQFRENLSWMLRLSREAGVDVMIGTVPSNLLNPALPEAAHRRYRVVHRRFEAGRYEDGLAVARRTLAETLGRHQASQVENGIIRSLAAEYAVRLVDVEAAVIAREPNGVPGETLFRDHCHLNVEGNRVWRQSFEAAIADWAASRPLR